MKRKRTRDTSVWERWRAFSALNILEQNLFIMFAIELLNVGISIGGDYGRDIAVLVSKHVGRDPDGKRRRYGSCEA